MRKLGAEVMEGDEGASGFGDRWDAVLATADDAPVVATDGR